MGIMQKTGAIALAVLVGFSVMSAMNSIKINSLDPQGDKISDVTKSISGETVQISNSRELKGLTAFNMFNAVDCRIVPWIVHINDKNDNAQHINELETYGNNHTAYFGNDNFRHVFEGTNYTATCASGSSIIYEGREAVEEARATGSTALLAAYEDSLRGLGEKVGAFEETPDNFATASADIVDSIENRVYSSIASESLWEQPSQDMEGVYGKVSFNVTEDFWIGGANSKNQLIAMRLADMSKLESGDKGWAIPPYFYGKRGSYFMPDGMKIKNSAGNKGKKSAFLSHEKNGNVQFGMMDYDNNNKFSKPGTAAMYAFRPRIETDQRRLVVSNHAAVASDDYPREKYYQKKIQKLIEHGRFRFCEGDEGYIQSNAGSISNSGEAEGQVSWREDTVFPEIVLNKEVKDCLTYGGPDNIQTTYSGISARGQSCTIGEAINRDEKESIDVEGAVHYCGLARKSLDLDGSYSGRVEYLTPGLYVADGTCPSPEEVNLFEREDSDVVFSQSPSSDDSGEYFEIQSNGDRRLYSDSEYLPIGLRWYIREWDDWTLKSTIDIKNPSNDPDANGNIFFYANGEKIAVYKQFGKNKASELKNMKTDGTDKSIEDNPPSEDDGGVLQFELSEDGSGYLKHQNLGTEHRVPLDISTDNPNGLIQFTIRAEGIAEGPNYDIIADIQNARLEGAVPQGCDS